jgi:hypothetical protein
VYSTNGHQWVEFDTTSGLTTTPAPMADFPSPNELRARWEAARGLDLSSELARPLSTPYRGGETSRRYYQDAAIRAVLEKIARDEKRALLSLATGAGKTYIAVHLLRRLADAGLLRRALRRCCFRSHARRKCTRLIPSLPAEARCASDRAAITSRAVALLTWPDESNSARPAAYTLRYSGTPEEGRHGRSGRGGGASGSQRDGTRHVGLPSSGCHAPSALLGFEA